MKEREWKLEVDVKAFGKVKLNLVGLLDARRQGKQVRIFESYKALSNYTKRKSVYCPKQAAMSEGIRVSLKHMAWEGR